MTASDAPTAPARPRRRDRRGRGMRGPGVLPQVPGRPRGPSPRDRFDDLVLSVVEELESAAATHAPEAIWLPRLGHVQYAVEDAPLIPDDWTTGTVPLSSLLRGARDRPDRIVLFRRPIEHRSASHADRQALVLTIVVEQLAELLGIEVEDIHPGLA